MRFNGMPSTAIRRIMYDPIDRELWVTFVSGRQYVYFDVPPEKSLEESVDTELDSIEEREVLGRSSSRT